MTEQSGIFAKALMAAKAHIISGEAGLSGNTYYTVRETAERYNISTVTAHKVIRALKDEYLLRTLGKTNYISGGLFHPDSTLHKQYSQSKYLGLHLNYIENTFFHTLARKIEDYASSQGFALIICISSRDTDKERVILDRFVNLGVKGVISVPTDRPNLVSYYSTYPLPFVFLANSLPKVKAPSIMVDNATASEMIGTYLYDKGYRQFCYILPKHLPQDNIRVESFVNFMKTKTAEPISLNILSPDQTFNLERYLKPYLQKTPKPIALYCHHDLLGIEAIRICQSMGLRIPEDVAITGFDNLQESTHITPSLTTVDYNTTFMVKESFRLLNTIMQGRQPDSGLHYIKPALIIRQST